MKPDKLDIRIQEAAAQHNPTYTDEAWSAMEKLLDEKMPQQKKEKRKFFWWIFFAFLLAGGILLLTTTKENKEFKEPSTIAGNISKPESGSVPAVSVPKTQSITQDHKPKPSQINDLHTLGVPSTSLKNQLSPAIAKNSRVNPNRESTNRNPAKIRITTSDPDEVIMEVPEYSNPSLTFQTGITKGEVVAFEKIFPFATQIDIRDAARPVPIIKNQKQDSILQKSENPTQHSKFLRRIALTISAGPDISAVSLKNIGTLKGVYGAGISFGINKRLTARTGFYISRKLYDAPPNAYNPPSGFWNYYPYVKRIDANCKIYEVPIILNYHFKSISNHQWFVSAGVSSYFMKTEAYSYFSKNPSGETWYNNYSIKNKNQHYLSSLRLSAGYKKKISNSVSLIAEPYLNLPLSGIGYGKVKLFSSGVLFTISMKPFSKQ